MTPEENRRRVNFLRAEEIGKDAQTQLTRDGQRAYGLERRRQLERNEHLMKVVPEPNWGEVT